MAGRALKTLTWLVVLCLIAAVAAIGWGYRSFNAPGPLTEAETLILPRGEGVLAISRRLADAGIVRDFRVFAVGVRLHRAERRLRAGEYRFPAQASMLQVMQQLAAGETVVRRLTLPEGLTVREAVRQINATEGLQGVIETIPPEGALLPETYHFSYGDDRVEMLERMRRAMRQVLAEAWPGRASELPLQTPEEALVLASIVERETALPEERARIAGVFINRLRRRMRLQSDPTVVYGITGGDGPLNRPLSRADLRRPTPFNTYVISGLPPEPICNPGRAAIEAVLKPLASQDLYFVADGKGGHAFAESYAQHQRNVRQWRRLERNDGQ